MTTGNVDDDRELLAECIEAVDFVRNTGFFPFPQFCSDSHLC